MMVPLFKVIKAGVYGSIQDTGRFGYQSFGVPVSGPMDKQAFHYGQMIVGNRENDPALELFLGGQIFEVLSNHRIVLTGADLGAMLDGKPVPIWKSFNISKGQTLTFTRANFGSIAYIILEGGFEAELLLGSASVYPKGQLGVPIQREMILYAKREKSSRFQTGLCHRFRPQYSNQITVNVWPSPHFDYFKEDDLTEFFQSTYTLKTGDRMGYLLEGPPLKFASSSDILSEATQFGTIQVPNSGQPIILMADCQTIGGYATIGKISADDLWKVAQMRKGGEIRFNLIGASC
ncbi:biotin-dependent carboxyltransferase family protein [Bacillus sp. B15-48]|uniref:5-oxoprolinase subunit C family protein n=1 Tax=Bacillus sp. B15-48 TaxID=1548601 RepID=UPI00193FC0BD|nr:biotin-dependent carboxyltransferase family protein [Bacillus sp. B15-48]MBM4760935.1 5-oxoprolinase/urea amidolyase family protein [Bacillus sp. B15-48]